MCSRTWFGWLGVLVLLTTGCGHQPTAQPTEATTAREEPIGETLNTEEAVERLEEHIANAVAVLPETLELEPVGPVVKGASCDDPTDGGSQDRVMAGRSYWLTGLPKEDNETNAELLHQHWIDNGYLVVRDGRPDKMSIAVRSEHDDFSLRAHLIW